jgi:hypothetical protein
MEEKPLEPPEDTAKPDDAWGQFFHAIAWVILLSPVIVAAYHVVYFILWVAIGLPVMPIPE